MVVPFEHLQLYERVFCVRSVSMNQLCGENVTYVVARVAVASDLSLATAKINTSVLVRGAPVAAHGLRDVVGGDRAARDRQTGGRVLRGRDAGKGRGGDEKGGVEHG